MRKLVILKSLVDFIWILSCLPLALLALIGIVASFSSPQSILTIFEIEPNLTEQPKHYIQLFLILYCILMLLGVYSIYLFRSTIRYFMKVKPFHEIVIKNFNKIGIILIIVGLSAAILLTVGRVVLNSQLKLSLGVSPYLIIICLGLFFMVLSEVFKIAKNAKEENDLTI